MLYRARQSVKNTINNITTFSLQGIVNAAIDVGLEYYDIDPNGTLGLTIKRVANQAVKYASGGSIDGLYKAESDSHERTKTSGRPFTGKNHKPRSSPKKENPTGQEENNSLYLLSMVLNHPSYWGQT